MARTTATTSEGRPLSVARHNATRLPLLVALSACTGAPRALPARPVPQTPPPPVQSGAPPAPVEPIASASVANTGSVAQCEAFDWTPGALPPLLRASKTNRALVVQATRGDQAAAEQRAFESECQDAPDGPRERSPTTVTIDGIVLGLLDVRPAGTSGRGWPGNQCAFSARLADGSGKPVRLAAPEVPPFNSISAVVRAGSAAFISVSFNGYSKEFPQGGNRVLALDLCAGRIVWQSQNDTSNGGLLLLNDYLISPFGFTSQPRSLYVINARSGAVLQRLPVVESICPSERWAPHWHRGEPCDAPGQKAGAATNPHVAAGLLLVDTNTGSAAFEFQQ